MKLLQEGQQEGKTILLLPPMLSDSQYLFSCFSFLGKKYCLLSLDYDGYGKEVKKDFSSAEKTAEEIVSLLLKKEKGHVDYVYAASLGARIFMDVIKEKRLSFDRILLDGLCLYENEEEARKFLVNMFLNEREKARSSFSEGKKFIASFYGEKDAPRLTDLFMKTSKKTIVNSLLGCTSYTFSPIDEALQKKMTLLYGAKEDDYLPVSKTFEERYPSVKIVSAEGKNHMELLRSGSLAPYLEKYLF